MFQHVLLHDDNHLIVVTFELLQISVKRSYFTARLADGPEMHKEQLHCTQKLR